MQSTASNSYSESDKKPTNLSFPALQQQLSNQTQFRILMMDAMTDACHMSPSLQKNNKNRINVYQTTGCS